MKTQYKNPPTRKRVSPLLRGTKGDLSYFQAFCKSKNSVLHRPLYKGGLSQCNENCKVIIFTFYILINFLFLSSISIFAMADSKNQVVKIEFNNILDSLKLEGSILIYDSKNDEYFSNDFKRAKTGFMPASTFKIPNTIIGLETSVLSDSTIFKWDGKPRRLKIWDKDLSLKDAFKVSCVPCYQENARNIGLERMKKYLKIINYPGMKFNNRTLVKFWLEGDSKISQFQQIDFLFRYWNNQLPISEKTKKIMDEVLLIEHNDSYSFYGKSGWAIRNGRNIGWFVGFSTIGNNVFYFAVNVIPKKDMNMDEFPASRILAAKRALEILSSKIN